MFVQKIYIQCVVQAKKACITQSWHCAVLALASLPTPSVLRTCQSGLQRMGTRRMRPSTMQMGIRSCGDTFGEVLEGTGVLRSVVVISMIESLSRY